jgi:hypothetical protein
MSIQVRPDDGAPARIELPLVAEVSRVTLDSDPQGATVSVEGLGELGVTPLTTDRLAPGGRAVVLLQRAGYADERIELDVPGPGGASSVSRELALSPEIATIVVRSEPPGARVFVDGEARGVTTPTDELQVAAGRKHAIRLELDGHVAAAVEVTPGRGARGLPVEARLVRAVLVAVTANLEARVTIDGVPGCERQVLPASCAVPAGRYEARIDVTGVPGRVIRPLEVSDQDIAIDVQLGVIEAPAGTRLIVNRKEVARIAVEAGKRTVTVKREDGTLVRVDVRVAAGSRPVKVKLPPG